MKRTENSKRKLAHGPTIHAIKQAKYDAKQKRMSADASSCSQQPSEQLGPISYANWFVGRDAYAAFVTLDDVRTIREIGPNNLVNSTEYDKKRLDRISSWIKPYCDLKEVPKQSNTNSSDEKSMFIAEGTESVRLMIQKCAKQSATSKQTSNNSAIKEVQKSPPVRIISIMCKPATFFDQPVCLLDELVKQQCISEENSCPFNIIVGTEEVLTEIVGFPVARGAMSAGVVPKIENPYQWLKGLLSSASDNNDRTNNKTANLGTQFTPIAMPATLTRPKRILALDAVSNTSNMGSIIRTAAAFGIDAIILSDDSCDAWYRQAVRVSMGHVITVPTIRVSELKQELNMEKVSNGGLQAVLKWFRGEKNVRCFAAVVDDDNVEQALPPLVSIESITRNQKENSWLCVFGNEGNGIRKEVVREVDFRIRINMMNDDVDSLSLPVAAGILIHGLSYAS